MTTPMNYRHMQLTSFIPLVVMDQCGGMKNKEKVTSSDHKEDENENEGLKMMMLFVIEFS